MCPGFLRLPRGGSAPSAGAVPYFGTREKIRQEEMSNRVDRGRKREYSMTEIRTYVLYKGSKKHPKTGGLAVPDRQGRRSARKGAAGPKECGGRLAHII